MKSLYRQREIPAGGGETALTGSHESLVVVKNPGVSQASC